mgnify:CR=1 FL=1
MRHFVFNLKFSAHLQPSIIDQFDDLFLGQIFELTFIIDMQQINFPVFDHNKGDYSRSTRLPFILGRYLHPNLVQDEYLMQDFQPGFQSDVVSRFLGKDTF